MKILASREDKVQYRSFEVKLTKVKFELTDDYEMWFEDNGWSQQNGSDEWMDQKTGIVVTDSSEIYDVTVGLLKRELSDQGYEPDEYIITAKILYTYLIYPDGSVVTLPEDFKVKGINCKPLNSRRGSNGVKAVEHFFLELNNVEFIDTQYIDSDKIKKQIFSKNESKIDSLVEPALKARKYIDNDYYMPLKEFICKGIQEDLIDFEYNHDVYKNSGVTRDEIPIFTLNIIIDFYYDLYEINGKEYAVKRGHSNWVEINDIELKGMYEVE